MEELLKKLEGNKEAFSSPEALRAAAKEAGASDEEIDKLIEAVGGFPLDDDALDGVAGGIMSMPSHQFYKKVREQADKRPASKTLTLEEIDQLKAEDVERIKRKNNPPPPPDPSVIPLA